MKNRMLFISLCLLFVISLTACAAESASPTPEPPAPTETKIIAPKPLPTATAEPTPPPPPTPVPLPTLPPGDATILFSGNSCSYEGPEKIPVTVPFLVNWNVESKDQDRYGLYVFMVEEGKTKEDLRNMFKSESPASWVIQAGSFDGSPWSSQQVTVISSTGKWFGELYFICLDSSKIMAILGPYNVAEANP